MKARNDSLLFFLNLAHEGKIKILKNGDIYRIWEKRRGFLEPPIKVTKKSSNGYVMLRTVFKENGVIVSHYVCAHRVVWSYFNGIADDDLEINHINAKKDDNRIENLELVTRLENQRHAVNMGLVYRPKEFQNKRCVLSNKDVDDIRRMLMDGVLLQREIASLYGVRPNQISRIKNFKRRV